MPCANSAKRYTERIYLNLVHGLLHSGEQKNTDENQAASDIDGPQKRNPFSVRPGTPEMLGEYMKAERYHDEESECYQLKSKAYLHDFVTSLLSRNVVGDA